MNGYLGEFDIDIKDTFAAEYTSADWALHFVTVYGGFDGAHHKAWVLDQVARILNGTRVIVKEARWENGNKELRYWTDEDNPSQKYLEWVIDAKAGEDGPNTYDYDEGIAP